MKRNRTPFLSLLALAALAVLVASCENPTGGENDDVGPARSSDATLSALSISRGTLSPVFSSSVEEYTVDLGNSGDTVTVTPVANQSGATITVNIVEAVPSGESSQPIDIVEGQNNIVILVIAEDGQTAKTYTITVNRATPETDATLSELALSGVTLTPAFDPGTYSYAADVENGVDSTEITASPASSSASVSFDPASPVALDVGENTIEVTVTAEDGTRTRIYTITVTRAAEGGGAPSPSTPTRTLEVSVSYTGSKTVDAENPILIAFFPTVVGASDFLEEVTAVPSDLAFTDLDTPELVAGEYGWVAFLDVDRSGLVSGGDLLTEGLLTMPASGTESLSIALDDAMEVEFSLSFEITGLNDASGDISTGIIRRNATAVQAGGQLGSWTESTVAGGAASIDLIISDDAFDPDDGEDYVFMVVWDKDDNTDLSAGDEYVVVSAPVTYEEANAPIVVSVDWGEKELYAEPAAAATEEIEITSSGGPATVTDGSFELAAIHLASFEATYGVFTASTDNQGDGTFTASISLYEGDHRLVLYFDEDDDEELGAGELYAAIDSAPLTGNGPHEVTFDTWDPY